MAYTVKQVARMSGVSVRTLHFYDERGLLKPAYLGANGYRFYEKPQLLILQQILFYRELGFELRQIKRILSQPDFKVMAALRSHRQVLSRNLDRTRQLIATIDKTIRHLKGTTSMKSEEMFDGFDPQEQARHEQALVDRCGEEMRESIAQSKAMVKHWNKADWQKSGAVFDEICRSLVQAMAQNLPPDSPAVRKAIRRHFEWMKQFWMPTRASYAGHSQLIVDSELRKAYEAHHPGLPEFTATAIRSFADAEL